MTEPRERAPAGADGSGTADGSPAADRPGGADGADGAAPRGLLAPSTLAPLELDLRTVFWVVTAGWGLALAIVLVVAWRGQVEGRIVAICATGFALGFVAQAWERWHSAAARRRAARSAAADAGPPPA